MNDELLSLIWKTFSPFIGKLTIGLVIVLAIGLLIDIIKNKKK